MNYIAYIDILSIQDRSGHTSATYSDTMLTFQEILLQNLERLKNRGRLHFFSDCAYIETEDPKHLINFLMKFRGDLMAIGIFLKGSVIRGALGAINGFETEDHLRKMYGNNEGILANYHSVKEKLAKYKDEIRGTLFFSSDVSTAYKLQNNLKGIGILALPGVVDQQSRGRYFVNSFYLRDVRKNAVDFFYDLKYEDSDLTEHMVRQVMRGYAISNTYSVKYGRFYLTILVSMINSSDFSKIKLSPDDRKGPLLKAPVIFNAVMNLRNTFPVLYERATGLEFLYFAIINKVYTDKKERNDTTGEILRRILIHRRVMRRYLNNLEELPDRLISESSKKLLIEDFFQTDSNT